MSIDSQPPSEHDLRRVALDNIRDNQLGGLSDGVTEKVAHEMGYTTDPIEISDISERAQAMITSDMQRSGDAVIKLTIAEQNANEKRNISAHRQRTQRQIRGR